MSNSTDWVVAKHIGRLCLENPGLGNVTEAFSWLRLSRDILLSSSSSSSSSSKRKDYKEYLRQASTLLHATRLQLALKYRGLIDGGDGNRDDDGVALERLLLEDMYDDDETSTSAPPNSSGTDIIVKNCISAFRQAIKEEKFDNVARHHLALGLEYLGQHANALKILDFFTKGRKRLKRQIVAIWVTTGSHALDEFEKTAEAFLKVRVDTISLMGRIMRHQGDAVRLWELADKIEASEQFSYLSLRRCWLRFVTSLSEMLQTGSGDDRICLAYHLLAKCEERGEKSLSATFQSILTDNGRTPLEVILKLCHKKWPGIHASKIISRGKLRLDVASSSPSSSSTSLPST